MAGSSLLMLLDDIATVLDDVAVMTKVAAKKTAGVLGDDLALNAQQVSGIRAERELPVVWAVAKGSMVNKAILVPGALIISAFIPWLIIPLLMVGGAYLCFEGFEKLAHKYLHSKQEDDQHHQELIQAVTNPEVDMVAFEQEKIKGAVRTDFILSAEIMAIALNEVSSQSIGMQAGSLVFVAIAITLAVYGVVGLIVKMDDIGLHLARREPAAVRAIGRGLVAAMPALLRTLATVGTAAMIWVGGGILVHGLEVLGAGTIAHWLHDAAKAASHAVPVGGAIVGWLATAAGSAVFGMIVGGVIVAVLHLVPKKH